MITTRTTLAALTFAALTLGACGGSDDALPSPDASTESQPEAVSPAGGLGLVSPTAAAETITDAQDDLVILDVRTPEEFAEGHIDGAILIDFYRDDFADELAKLDPDVPYVLYCRSGNRSGETIGIMDNLGFTQVDEVEGGVLGWQDAGLPLVTE